MKRKIEFVKKSAGAEKKESRNRFLFCYGDEEIEMEKKKVRATRTNGRKDSNGVFKAGHNDRLFNLENAEHVDADRSKWNVYWDYLQGYNLADEKGV